MGRFYHVADELICLVIAKVSSLNTLTSVAVPRGGSPLFVRVPTLATLLSPFLEMGWRVDTNRQWGESPRVALAHPPSLAHSRSRVYHNSLSSLCSVLLPLPSFSPFYFPLGDRQRAAVWH